MSEFPELEGKAPMKRVILDLHGVKPTPAVADSRGSARNRLTRPMIMSSHESAANAKRAVQAIAQIVGKQRYAAYGESP